jgi:hypothetical protein
MSQKRIARAALKRAIKIAGSRATLAKQIKCDRQLIDYYLKTGQISHRLVRAASEATGVPLHELRPDLYTAP